MPLGRNRREAVARVAGARPRRRLRRSAGRSTLPPVMAQIEDSRPSTGRRAGHQGTARRGLVEIAMGRKPADVVVRGGRLVNVATAEIHPADVAIGGDRIAAVGDVDYTIGEATTFIDADGRFITPGLVDGHLHMYHSYLGVPEFVEAMLRHGVTATADGFYGQGIVGGMDAIRWFKDAFERMPLRVLFLVPTLAYLQNRELGLSPDARRRRRRHVRDARLARLLRRRRASVPADRGRLAGVPRALRGHPGAPEGRDGPRLRHQHPRRRRRTSRWAATPITRRSTPTTRSRRRGPASSCSCVRARAAPTFPNSCARTPSAGSTRGRSPSPSTWPRPRSSSTRAASTRTSASPWGTACRPSGRSRWPPSTSPRSSTPSRTSASSRRAASRTC